MLANVLPVLEAWELGVINDCTVIGHLDEFEDLGCAPRRRETTTSDARHRQEAVR